MRAVATGLGGVGGERDRGGRRAGRDAGDQRDAAAGGARDRRDDGAALLGAEAPGLAHRPVGDDAVHAGVEVGRDVALERGLVDRAGGVERRGDGGDDAFEVGHGPIMPRARGGPQWSTPPAGFGPRRGCSRRTSAGVLGLAVGAVGVAVALGELALERVDAARQRADRVGDRVGQVDPVGVGALGACGRRRGRRGRGCRRRSSSAARR